MKVEFYVEGTYYYKEYPTPSVVIIVRNNIEGLSPTDPILASDPRNMEAALNKMYTEESKIHKTSFIITLDQYRDSGIKVGDKILIEIKIVNTGDITK